MRPHHTSSDQFSTTQFNDELQIVEEKPDHHYRTEIPNIVFELGLSANALALYCYLKKVAGDSGKCWQSQKTICKSVGMTEKTLRKCVDELCASDNKFGLALIKKSKRKNPDGGNTTDILTIVNIWKSNGDFYRKSEKRGGGENFPRGGWGKFPYKQDPYTKVSIDINKDNVKEPLKIKASKPKPKPVEVQKKTLPSFSKNRTLDAPQRFKLSKEQTATYHWLKEKNINTDDATLCFWAKTYTVQRLSAVLSQVVKSKPKNIAAYMQTILRKNSPIHEENITKNLEFAQDYKKSNGWTELQIKKDCVQIGSHWDLSLNIDPVSFAQHLMKKHEKN